MKKKETVSLPDSEEVYSSVRDAIVAARKTVNRAVNSAMVLAYWEIGRIIYESAGERSEYGADLLKYLSKKLVKEFGNGFGVTNLKYMRQFYLTYPIRHALRGELSWTHYRLLIKIETEKEREFYQTQCIKANWSTRQLEHYIGMDLYSLQRGEIISNFKSAIPEKAEEVASVFKNPYVFDFLDLGKACSEKILEDSLVENVSRTLLEFGSGFAVVGRQVHLEVEGEDFYIDLLFYHLRLHCYVVVDLKTGKFTPEYAGKMNFYLSAVDDMIKTPEDKPSIGLILCKDRRGLIAEYALRNLEKPLGVAEYVLASDLPEALKKLLPDVSDFSEDIVRELQTAYKRKGQ